jgi:hypothetical protein
VLLYEPLIQLNKDEDPKILEVGETIRNVDAFYEAETNKMANPENIVDCEGEITHLPTPQSMASPIIPNEATGFDPQPSTRQSREARAVTNTAPNSNLISSFEDTSFILEGPRTGTRNKARKTTHTGAVTTSATQYSGYYQAFSAALSFKGPPLVGVGIRHHRDQLPPEPRNWSEMRKHPLALQFTKAAEVEYSTLREKGMFKHVALNEPTRHGRKPIGTMWRFTYKLDPDGYLVRCKARLCARGDLQITESDTYATTLAARTFRALIAIAAAFGLVMRQYDMVNAFANADIDEPTYIYCPQGYHVENTCIRILKALYGLKQSPLLWHRTLSTALGDFGFTQIPGVECLFSNGKLLIFFFIDDIIVISHPKNIDLMERFEQNLCQRYETKCLGEPQWFLGIRIIRNIEDRSIWLCQDSYIEKITSRFNLGGRSRVKIPLPVTFDRERYNGSATLSQIHKYQQLVGSINYPAIITRPDVAKSASLLSEHLRNPSPGHQDAAEHCIAYLYHSRYRAIRYYGSRDYN